MMVWYFRKRSYLLIGWLWYLGTMVPMIGLVQSGRQGMADRYMYIPILGLLMALVWGIADWADALKLRQGLVTVAFLAVALAYVYGTRTQIGYWKNSCTLFAHAVEVTTNNAVAENNLGSALVEMGQAQLAESHFAAAVRLMPSLASAHYNLGVLLQERQQLPEAAKQYLLAIANSTDALEAAQAHNNLGILYMEAKDFPAATSELNRAIALNPDEQNSYIGRATIELQAGNYDGAIVDFAHAAQIAPSPTACYWLGRALESKGDYRRASSAYAAALQLAPGMAEARTRLQALQSKTSERR
jgi:tetratricopeptide (TPR) repeat protein